MAKQKHFFKRVKDLVEGQQSLREFIANEIEIDRKKIGGMHAPAMAVKGLEELRAAFSLNSPIEQPSNPGIYGLWTPGEVAAERDNDPKVQHMEQEAPANEPPIAPPDPGGGPHGPQGPEGPQPEGGPDPLEEAKQRAKEETKQRRKVKDRGMAI